MCVCVCQDAIRNGFHDVADVLEAHGAVVTSTVMRKFLRDAVEAGNLEVPNVCTHIATLPPCCVHLTLRGGLAVALLMSDWVS